MGGIGGLRSWQSSTCSCSSCSSCSFLTQWLHIFHLTSLYLHSFAKRNHRVFVHFPPLFDFFFVSSKSSFLSFFQQALRSFHVFLNFFNFFFHIFFFHFLCLFVHFFWKCRSLKTVTARFATSLPAQPAGPLWLKPPAPRRFAESPLSTKYVYIPFKSILGMTAQRKRNIFFLPF